MELAATTCPNLSCGLPLMLPERDRNIAFACITHREFRSTQSALQEQRKAADALHWRDGGA